MVAYYNEIDAKAAAWLRELIHDGLIAPGDVDERSIRDVSTPDLKGYTQCHFFAGIGGWSYALRLAGWSDESPVWTGSCPCQPFSCAGKRAGVRDERHLWPVFCRLIAECHPPVVFGEQVASAPGRTWLSGVRTSLEYLAYSVGGADLCAASVGAPHIRQRLFWVAASGREFGLRSTGRGDKACGRSRSEVAGPGVARGLADSDRERLPERTQQDRGAVGSDSGTPRRPDAVRCVDDGGLADSLEPGLEGHAGDGADRNEPGREHADAARPVAKSSAPGRLGDTSSAGSGRDAGTVPRAEACGSGARGEARREPDEPEPADFWSDSRWLQCADGKAQDTS